MFTRPPRLRRVIALVSIIAAATCPVLVASATADSSHHTPTKPTVVLVHGAWADASGWNAVSTELRQRGYTVIAPANLLRGVQTDSAYLRSVLTTIKGPIVLVGHSYGGMVITNAAVGDPQVKALVYIAAFAPTKGETAGAIEQLNPGTQATGSGLTVRPFPGGKDVYITPSVFHRVFCADLSARQAADMAASQRPLALSAFSDPSGTPAWKTIPSWYMVANQDHAIPPVTERFMAKRMGATTVQVNSSHVAMISHPDAVTKLITRAAHAVR